MMGQPATGEALAPSRSRRHYPDYMALPLPYSFDTSPVVKLILRGVLGLLLVVIVPGIGYSLLVTHDLTAAVSLLVAGLIVVYFGRLFLQNLVTSRGTITADTVIVEPGTLYGIQLPGPRGRFRVQQFSSVRVERIAPSGEVQHGRHERVTIIGCAGTPDILLARTSDDAGRALGQALATALGLPYTEQIAPY